MAAAAKGDEGIVSKLLRYGSNINKTDDQGRTVLMWAISRGHLQVARILVAPGANHSSGMATEHLSLEHGTQ